MEQATQTPATEATTGLTWTTQLAVGDARMDDTHVEFVNQLNALLATPVEQQLPLYRAFLDHTVGHFAQEERWMLATGFAPDNCHASHHATILEHLKAVGFDSATETLADASVIRPASMSGCGSVSCS